MSSVIHRGAVVALAVWCAVLVATPANLSATVGAEIPSGAGVLWMPERLERLNRSLRGEMTDPSEATEIAQIVHSEASELDLDPLYVLAIMKVESGFRSDAVSPKGAIGLLQVQPIAARAVARAEPAVAGPARPQRLHDPRTNVAIGLRYLRHLEREFGDRATVLTAYNMGPTRLRATMKQSKRVRNGYAARVLTAYRRLRADLDG